MSETPHEKFVRLSTARLEKAQHAIKQLTHLGSKNYEFSVQEAEEIVRALTDSVGKVSDALNIPAQDVATISYEDYVGTKPGGKTMADGPLELTPEETTWAISQGDQLNAIINTMEDREYEKAHSMLLNLMRS
tara:strand:+ start:1205 stop:1603 length:399 start_codon:yes stop_codon:yes gene_type:complete